MALRIQVEPNESKKSESKNHQTLNWALNPLFKWMCCLGLPPPSESRVFSNTTKYLIALIRILIFVLVFSTHLWLVINICLNAKSVAMSYTNGYSSGAVAWNFIIDAFNFSVYVIVSHACLIFLTQPKHWNVLIKSFQRLEESSTVHHIYKKCRYTMIYLITYVIVSVCMNYLKNIKINSIDYFVCFPHRC